MKKLQQRSENSRSRFRFFLLRSFWLTIHCVYKDAAPLFHLGNLYFAYGYTNEAIQYWGDAVTKDKKHIKAWHNIVQFALSQEDWKRAEEGLNILCQLLPKNLDYISRYAFCLKQQKRTEELEQWYKRHFDTHQVWAVTEFGMYLTSSKREAEAYAFLIPFAKRYSDQPQMWKYLGICCFRLKKYSEALHALEKYLDLENDPHIELLVNRIKLSINKKVVI